MLTIKFFLIQEIRERNERESEILIGNLATQKRVDFTLSIRLIRLPISPKIGSCFEPRWYPIKALKMLVFMLNFNSVLLFLSCNIY